AGQGRSSAIIGSALLEGQTPQDHVRAGTRPTDAPINHTKDISLVDDITYEEWLDAPFVRPTCEMLVNYI
ncbi:hypothetical protein HDU87_000908, partial [Geranomyces variabilis]